jgi:dinuclear metal center YbgI/SA1388 family protein
VAVRTIQEILERWAPPEIAWERDNVGLQVGDPDMRVRSVLVALDCTEGIVAEAARRRANLIVTHHPLLFRAPRALTTGSGEGRCVQSLVRNRIALYSAHTNLDFTRGGTSFALASALGLEKQAFLRRSYKLHNKIVTFVPPAHVDAVVGAMSAAGAGVIGEYDHCSFRTEGTGTFRGNERSQPSLGRRGVLEHVREIRVEMSVPHRALEDVVRALKTAHPYEEVAYDIYPLENLERDYGMGVVGTLPRSVPLSGFLRTVRKALGARTLRWTGAPNRVVRRVAVCGGSGSELLSDAVASGAEVFVTADVRYHSFHEAAGRIAIVDAGHYETEFPVIASVVDRLRRDEAVRRARTPIRAAALSTNPVEG